MGLEPKGLATSYDSQGSFMVLLVWALLGKGTPYVPLIYPFRIKGPLRAHETTLRDEEGSSPRAQCVGSWCTTPEPTLRSFPAEGLGI